MGGHDTGWRLAALGLAFVAGVALQLAEPSLMPGSLYLAVAGAALPALAAAWRWRRTFVVGVVAMAALGFGSAGWRADARLRDALPTQLEGQDLLVTGVVAGLPQRGPSGVRFRFDVEQASLDGRPVALPSRLALGWYGGFHEDAGLSSAQQGLGAGQRWRLGLRLRQPHGNLNPHGFDYELSLFEQGVRATGTVRDAPAPQRLAHAAGHPVERLRQRVRDAIEAGVPDRRAAGVLAALAVGDQSAIEREDWDLFRNTGIAHLVSISGLHITMFAWLAGIGIGALWRRSRRACLWLPAQRAAQWGGLAAASAYAVFSGWGVPSQRTVWMLATVTLLQSLGRRWPWPLVLVAAAAVVCAFDPWALLQPGFWLSFVAVGLLMASSVAHRVAAGDGALADAAARGRLARVGAHLHGELRSQLVATVGLTPLTLVFFQQVSVVGFLANLVAIPLITLVVTPLAILGVAAAPLWVAGAWVVQQLCRLLAWFAGWPGAVWTVAAAPAWAQLAGLAAAALLVMPLPWRARALALPLALPLLLPSVWRPAAGQFELVAADIGQGTAVLVRTREHLLLYDAGPQYARDSDAGQRVLLPLLRARGESRIDRLVLSHRDTDHVGGAKSLLQGMPVVDVWSSLEEGHPLRAIAPSHQRCVHGQSWEWDGVRFEMLQPPPEAYEHQRKSNGLSCVLRVAGATRSLLLTGDAEREQEAWLVATLGEALRSDVLVAPHHGSKTSSTAAFLDAVRPAVAVFQAGYRNRFGHPAPEVMARYAERGIATPQSASCGAWTWRSESPTGGDGQGICQRDADRAYWHHGAMPGRTGAFAGLDRSRGLDFANLPVEDPAR
jgi:competence protein ComEC